MTLASAPAASATTSSARTSDDAAPLWTSPRLIGHDAPAQLVGLAQALSTHAQGTANLAPSQRGGASAPGKPAPGAPCNAGLGAAGAGGGLSSGSWAAVGVPPVACRPVASLEPHASPPALWRPTVFISLQERPG